MTHSLVLSWNWYLSCLVYFKLDQSIWTYFKLLLKIKRVIFPFNCITTAPSLTWNIYKMNVRVCIMCVYVFICWRRRRKYARNRRTKKLKCLPSEVTTPACINNRIHTGIDPTEPCYYCRNNFFVFNTLYTKSG